MDMVRAVCFRVLPWGSISAPAARRASFLTYAPPVTIRGRVAVVEAHITVCGECKEHYCLHVLTPTFVWWILFIKDIMRDMCFCVVYPIIWRKKCFLDPDLAWHGGTGAQGCFRIRKMEGGPPPPPPGPAPPRPPSLFFVKRCCLMAGRLGRQGSLLALQGEGTQGVQREQVGFKKL